MPATGLGLVENVPNKNDLPNQIQQVVLFISCILNKLSFQHLS